MSSCWQPWVITTVLLTAKDLVLNGEKSIRLRINQRMIEVIDPICQTNDDARKNRYYIERRFVGLLQVLCFGLQRICRRTGADSRASLDEMRPARSYYLYNPQASPSRSGSGGFPLLMSFIYTSLPIY